MIFSYKSRQILMCLYGSLKDVRIVEKVYEKCFLDLYETDYDENCCYDEK